jgi:hypothetical protein
VLALDWIAEEKIAGAVARGELDDLPGAGKPLELEDDALVPEELRMTLRILRNAGMLPPEIEQAKAAKKLTLLRIRIESRYYEKVARKLAR